MPTEDTSKSSSGLDVTKLFSELEVPFSPDQVRWRVTNTTSDKKRGQIVPYADSRAYTDRLNALFTPQGWTREYKVETMTNITRVKKGESIVSGKVLVTCTVTILGLGSHSGTGEEWADDDNGMTSADAQAFKRACSCFGLGRYFYDIQAVWVDLDQNRQPLRTPACSPGPFRRAGAKECGLRAGMATAAPLQPPTAEMKEPKSPGAAPLRFPAPAITPPATPASVMLRATISMRVF
jgi:Rad52/22 family double-strand break repair protein